MNRRQRDQNRENALRLSIVVAEHAEYPVYPNAVLVDEQVRKLTDYLIDIDALTV